MIFQTTELGGRETSWASVPHPSHLCSSELLKAGRRWVEDGMKGLTTRRAVTTKEVGWSLEHHAMAGKGRSPTVPGYQQTEDTGSRWRAGERAVQSGLSRVSSVTGTEESLPKGPVPSPNYNLFLPAI